MGQVLQMTRRTGPAAGALRGGWESTPSARSPRVVSLQPRREQPCRATVPSPAVQCSDPASAIVSVRQGSAGSRAVSHQAVPALGAPRTGAQVPLSARSVRRRAAAQARGAARARRVASASVDGSLADLELTRRGRWVLWSTALAVAAGMAVMGGGALASTPDLPPEVVPHTVAEGEHLWGLAESIALPGEDLRDVVELIIEVNGRASASLWAGEQILLPVRG